MHCLRTEPMTYKDLRRIFADNAALRQKLRRLEREGAIVRDQGGAYVVDAADHIIGVVQAGLTGPTLADLPLQQIGRKQVRVGDRIKALPSGASATVLRVLDHSDRPLVGVFRADRRGAYLEALGSDRVGRVSLADGSPYAQDGAIVRVRVIGQDRDGLVGRIDEVLGGETTLDAAVNAAVTGFGISVDNRVAAATIDSQVGAADRSGRVDLRSMPLVTIDGASAKDFDDAVYAVPKGDGFRLVVAIADVAHYVSAGSALDASACERGTSVYFPNTVFPMLPEALSNGICSLRPREDRLALVCDMQVNPAGSINSYRFYEAVIRSRARLTYAEVQSLNQGAQLPIDGETAKSLAALFDVYRALRLGREARGALDFESFEGVPLVEDGAVTAINPVVRHDSHRLIEEAMIAANVCAAEFLGRQGASGLYRVHEPPDAERVESLASAFKLAGLSLPKQGLTTPALQRALRSISRRADCWLYEKLTLQAMQRAFYTPKRAGHFALALAAYTHFTSPIRRYPDLVVHRIIKALLRRDRQGHSNPEQLEEVGHMASMAERRAQDASRMVDAWLKCAYLAAKVGDCFPAVIAGVAEFGLFAELEGCYIQGLLHVSSLGGDYFQYIPPFHMVGETTGVSYRLGEPVQVRLVGVQPELGRLNLELAQSPGGRRAPRHGGVRRKSNRGRASA